MSELKLKYDEARKTEIEKQNEEKKSEPNNNIELYDSPGNTRNLCLVLADGKQVFLNYAYLISGEFSPEDGTISLAFTTHLVTLKGHSMESLFDALMENTPKQIKSIEERYVPTIVKNENVVIEINVVKIT